MKKLNKKLKEAISALIDNLDTADTPEEVLMYSIAILNLRNALIVEDDIPALFY